VTAPVLREGDEGPWVERLQHLLSVEGYYLIADGDFGPKTDYQVRCFQANENLDVDGVVGEMTWAALEDAHKAQPGDDVEEHGWAVKPPPDPPQAPARPDFEPIRGNVGRHEVFGYFKYAPAPTPGNPESIRFLDDWPDKNIITVEIPQLKLIKGVAHESRMVGYGPKSGMVSCHHLVATQMRGLWQAWEDHGLLHLVLTWAGLWAPRFIRRSRSVLSNHCFGTAFDINAPWNGFGQEPAGYQERGCVWDLVELAHEHGFYWGGHFQRKDGMHFEVAKVL